MCRRGLGYVLALTAVMTVAGAAGMFGFENGDPGLRTFGDARNVKQACGPLRQSGRCGPLSTRTRAFIPACPAPDFSPSSMPACARERL